MEFLREHAEAIFYTNNQPEEVAGIRAFDIDEINDELVAANKKTVLLYDDLFADTNKGTLHVLCGEIYEDFPKKEFNVYSTILSNSDKNPATPFVVKSNFMIMNWYVYTLMEQVYNWH